MTTVHVFSPPITMATIGEHRAVITAYCDELGPWLGLVWRKTESRDPPMQMRWTNLGHAQSPWLEFDIPTEGLTAPAKPEPQQ